MLALTCRLMREFTTFRGSSSFFMLSIKESLCVVKVSSIKQYLLRHNAKTKHIIAAYGDSDTTFHNISISFTTITIIITV